MQKLRKHIHENRKRIFRDKKYKQQKKNMLAIWAGKGDEPQKKPGEESDSEYEFEDEDIRNYEKKLYFGEDQSDETYFDEYQKFL